MTEGIHDRQRCTECRAWYRRAPTASTSQKVCGPACRKVRNRKLAGVRRSKDPWGFREDERRRQRESRARRKTAAATGVTGPPVTRGHAPSSAPNTRQLQRKVLEAWDTQSAVSRATFARMIAEITEGFGASAGTGHTAEGTLSRVTLAIETPVILDGS